MMILNPPSATPSPKSNKWIVTAILIFSFLGFVDAAYLTVSHYQNKIPPCSITAGCETVLTSTYATVAGVPLALLGALFYLLIFTVAQMYRHDPDMRLLKYLRFLTIIGFLVSLGLLSLQLFVIHAICIYCMGSIISNLCMMPLGQLLWRRRGNFS